MLRSARSSLKTPDGHPLFRARSASTLLGRIVIDAFVEGVRSIVQACHLVILAPVAMMIVAAKGRWQVVVGSVAGIVVGGWIFVTRWLIFTDLQLRLSAIVVIAALVAVSFPSLLQTRPTNRFERARSALDAPWSSAVIAGAVAIIVALWWRPCVGEQLGDILTLAPSEPWSQIFPAIGFMLGISIPLVLIGLGYAVWQPERSTAAKSSLVAGSLGMVLAGSVVIGQHGEIVAQLFEWSQ